MSCIVNCSESDLSHEAENLICFGLHPAGSPQIIIFWCLDNISDITNPTQILTAIAAGEALRVRDILFGSDPPTPTLGPKPTACGTPKVLFNTFNMSATDYSYNQTNNELWGDLGNGRSVAAVLAWDCTTNPNYPDTSRYYLPTSGGISWSGGLGSPNNDDEVASFVVNGTFKGTVTIIPTPAGVFLP